MNEHDHQNILAFPTLNAPQKVQKRKRIKNTDRIKYFNAPQIKIIRRQARDQAELDFKKGKITGIREWMAIDLLTSTGLRVSEAANLRVGDLKLGYGESKIFVNEGKGHISGSVVINDFLKKHLKQYVNWKKDRGESTGEEDYLFIGQRGKWTSQALQQIVKKYLKELDLYELGKSVHDLRHSYAVELYAKENDLRTVQKQLRHVSISSTIIYADVTDERLSEQIKGLWN